MRLFIAVIALFGSQFSWANCLSLKNAQDKATKAIQKIENSHQVNGHGDLFFEGWQNAVEELRFDERIRGGGFSHRWTVNTWEDVEIVVQCDGQFSYEIYQTENEKLN